MTYYEKIVSKIKLGRKQLAVLIDPDQHETSHTFGMIEKSIEANVDMLLFGGSLITNNIIKEVIDFTKSISNVPTIIFPGSIQQVSEEADALLYLSLISGRNPDFLIGRHVESAMQIKNLGIEVIPTGYMLIDCGSPTSVNYMSNTQPIPRNKSKIATSTAIAGELLGMKLIYLEAGSGADQTVPLKTVSEVKRNIDIPLIVGGGISTTKDATRIVEAGADIVVIGTAIERNPNLVFDMSLAVHTAQKTVD